MNTLAGIPPAFDEKLGNMSRSFWPEAVKLLSTLVYPLRNWPYFAERVQEARSGQLSLDRSRSRISVAVTPSNSSIRASGLKDSLLNSSAISSHGPTAPCPVRHDLVIL
jgi:hypothetical protein